MSTGLRHTLASTASDIMRSSSFHDLSMWEEDSHESAPPAGALPPPVVKREGSAHALRVLSPLLLNAGGTALSPAGVAALTAAGVAACHSLRLVLREAMESVTAHSPRSRASWRTFELYMLSLLHAAAWIAFGARRLASRKAARHEDLGGTTRALGLSAGYHLYVLLSLQSVWTHPLATAQHLGELVGIASQLTSERIGWLVPLTGATRSLPTFFLTALSALEHLGEHPSSPAFRALRAAASASIVACKGVLTPLLLRQALTRPELHQPSLLPRKLVTLADAAASLAWLLARWTQSRPAASALPALRRGGVAAELAAAAARCLHQLRMHTTVVLLTTALQAVYLAAPTALLAAPLLARRLPRRAAAALAAAAAALLASTRLPLPSPQRRLLSALLLRSGLVRLLKEYHSFRLIEEVPYASLPSYRGKLYACFPHGVVPYGVILLWCQLLERGVLLGGLAASSLFRIPLLRHFLAAIGIAPATAANLAARLATPRSDTFLVPGGIAEMFLNDPQREVVQLASRKGFCAHALRAGAPLLPVYIFGQTQLFYTLSGRLQAWLRRLSRTLGVSIIPFVGRSWLSPFVPLQQPITCVVGRPINVDAPPIARPTQQQVDALHAAFCVEIRRLFETYKHMHPGFESRRLYFDGEEPGEDEALLEEQRERRRLEEFHIFPAKL